jgi:hypothetical protein
MKKIHRKGRTNIQKYGEDTETNREREREREIEKGKCCT